MDLGAKVFDAASSMWIVCQTRQTIVEDRQQVTRELQRLSKLAARIGVESQQARFRKRIHKALGTMREVVWR